MKNLGELLFVLKVVQSLLARTTEKGALCYVDTACKGKESHGKYLNHQKVYRYFAFSRLFEWTADLTRPEEFVTSVEGVRIRGEVWSEILNALEKAMPNIRGMISFRNGD
jgi:hypothetical protein